MHRIQELLPVRPLVLAVILAVGTSQCVYSQAEPVSAHVNLYFPQLADGGTFAQRWQTRLDFLNPHASSSALVLLDFIDNSGRALSLDFGAGPVTRLSFSLPPGGSRSFRTTGNSPNTVVGWAIGSASLPIQGNVIFRSIEQGVPRVDISAPSVLPGHSYWSIANRDLGVAVGNPYSNASITLAITATSDGGVIMGQGTVQLPPLGHAAFNLVNIIPSLPPTFRGSIRISTSGTAYFVAWTLNASDGVLSSLPGGASHWPISHYDRIWMCYWKVLDAAQRVVGPALGIDLYSPIVELRIDGAREINAFASPQNIIQINLALSQLISDSPSEMAFVIGHELGHIIQFRTRTNILHQNPELDADQMGMLFNLVAGYDPYAGAGALAKMSMASGASGLLSQILIDHFDIHQSSNTRIQGMFDLLRAICSDQNFASFCTQYKNLIHPNFPNNIPLSTPPQHVAPGTPQFDLLHQYRSQSPSTKH